MLLGLGFRVHLHLLNCVIYLLQWFYPPPPPNKFVFSFNNKKLGISYFLVWIPLIFLYCWEINHQNFNTKNLESMKTPIYIHAGGHDDNIAGFHHIDTISPNKPARHPVFGRLLTFFSITRWSGSGYFIIK
jgi:hypothetical protein